MPLITTVGQANDSQMWGWDTSGFPDPVPIKIVASSSGELKNTPYFDYSDGTGGSIPKMEKTTKAPLAQLMGMDGATSRRIACDADGKLKFTTV